MRNLHSHGRLAFSASLAQDGKSRKGLGVNLRNQKVLAATILLPHLADLDLFRGHSTTLDTIPRSVNNRPRLCFASATPLPPRPAHPDPAFALCGFLCALCGLALVPSSGAPGRGGLDLDPAPFFRVWHAAHSIAGFHARRHTIAPIETATSLRIVQSGLLGKCHAAF